MKTFCHSADGGVSCKPLSSYTQIKTIVQHFILLIMDENIDRKWRILISWFEGSVALQSVMVAVVAQENDDDKPAYTHSRKIYPLYERNRWLRKDFIILW